MPQTEYKTVDLKEVSDAGEITALVSTFGLDRDGDIMTAEAFAGSKGKRIPMVWSHDWDQPIGAGTIQVTADGAIFNGNFFLETAKGAEAFKTVKAMGSLQQYSIGFRIVEQSWEMQDDGTGGTKYIRTIKDLELFEASPVLVGAAYGTRTLAVKQHSPAESARNLEYVLANFKQITVSDEILMAVDTLLDSIEGAAEAIEGLLGIEDEPEELAARLAELQTKAGATLNASNLKRLHTSLGALMAMHDASNCAGDDNCPMTDGAKTGKPGDYPEYVSAERKAAFEEFERVLGFRPLVAGSAKK